MSTTTFKNEIKISNEFNIDHLDKFTMLYNTLIKIIGLPYKTIFIYNTFGSTILLKFDPTQQCKKFEDSVAHRQLTILIEIFDELLRKNWLLGYTFYKEELKYMNNVYKQLTEMGYKQNTTLNYMTK